MENLLIEFKTKFWRECFGITPLSLSYFENPIVGDFGVMGERADRWQREGREEVWGESEVGNEKKEGKEICWMNKRRKKKRKKVGNENLGENFCEKKKKSVGESLSYRVFFFYKFNFIFL